MRIRWGRSLAVIALVLLVAASGAGAWTAWKVRESFPAEDGQLTLEKLSAPVDVRRDAWGVPHIYADTAEDLFVAQGYVQAQDRFFEMDLRRHLTSGRLAEWFGPGLLKTDMLFRAMGWRRTADAEYAKLSPEAKSYLDAYTDGVNAYLDEHRGSARSFEYLGGWLGPAEDADPWSPSDSLAWLKMMAWTLRSNVDDEVARVLATTKVPEARVGELYPFYPYEKNPPIVTTKMPESVTGSGQKSRTPGRAIGSALTFNTSQSQALSEVKRILGAISPTDTGLGSNSWVVSGSKTKSGKPLLANDPHLGAAIPSVWYQSGLHCRPGRTGCPFDVSGFSFAGVPGIIIGHNQRIAWGLTNLGADVTDLYIERIDNNSYLYDGKRLPLESRRETFRIKGRPEVTADLRATRHGPLLSDVDNQYRKVAGQAPAFQAVKGDGLEAGIALRWTALEPGRSAEAIFELDRAKDWATFRAAAAKFDVPSQNLVYADVDGHIGYQAPGKIPMRKAGSGEWPVPGWTSEYEWTGYIPFQNLPSVLDPPEGFIATANNAVTGNDYPYRLADHWSYGYRSKRIRDLLVAKGPLDVAAMTRMQVDTKHGFAATLKPWLLKTKVDAFTAEGQQLLRGWNGEQGVDSAAAAYFNATWKHLLRSTFADELPKEVWPVGGDRWYEVVRKLLDDPDNKWWDDARTKSRVETRDDMLRKAMSDARLELTKLLSKDPAEWRWGRVHRLELRNQTLGSSGIAPLEALFNRGPWELPGGSDAVLATGWNAGAKYFNVTSVPSMRMVVDLSNLDKSRWIDLTGVSGHPWHPHYADQTPLWATGRTLPWPFSEKAVIAATKTTLVLTP